MNPIEEINFRINDIPKNKILNAHTTLHNFSIITYLVEKNKLSAHIPKQFDIFTLIINSVEYGLISAVSFIDLDFNFKNILPFYKISFPQTNYRTYIIDKKTGENCAWFFGTGIESKFFNIPKFLWKMPWFYSKYETKFIHNNYFYETYKIEIKAKKSNAKIELVEDILLNNDKLDFCSYDELLLILTHPTKGYYYRSDGKIGFYKIWHPKIEVKTGKAKNLYFEKFEKLNLLNAEKCRNLIQ